MRILNDLTNFKEEREKLQEEKKKVKEQREYFDRLERDKHEWDKDSDYYTKFMENFEAEKKKEIVEVQNKQKKEFEKQKQELQNKQKEALERQKQTLQNKQKEVLQEQKKDYEVLKELHKDKKELQNALFKSNNYLENLATSLHAIYKKGEETGILKKQLEGKTAALGKQKRANDEIVRNLREIKKDRDFMVLRVQEAEGKLKNVDKAAYMRGKRHASKD